MEDESIQPGGPHQLSIRHREQWVQPRPARMPTCSCVQALEKFKQCFVCDRMYWERR
jgi:hypothetical protein